MIQKLYGMKIKKRLNFGYVVVIILMVLSGIFSIISLGVLKGSLDDFVNGSNRADTAVKMCRIEINIAARSIREMALNDDTDTYADYRQKVKECLDEIGTELEALQGTGLISQELFSKYENALTAWGAVGYEIMDKLEVGDDEGAVAQILTECAPALDDVIVISKEIDAVTDDLMQSSVRMSQWVFFILEFP